MKKEEIQKIAFLDTQKKYLIQEIDKLKTDERKVAIFGKGMDSWEARTYDEKKLVNAVLDTIKKTIFYS